VAEIDRTKVTLRTIAFTGIAILLLAMSWFIAQRPSAAQTRYHCPMHPDYVTTQPGNCPICGMRLIPVEDHLTQVMGGQERLTVELPPEMQRVLGVSLIEARERSLEKTIHAAGRVSMSPPARMTASEEGMVKEVFRNPGPAGSIRMGTSEPILSLSTSTGAVMVQAPGPLVLISVPAVGTAIEKGKELYSYIDLSTLFILAEIRSADIPLIQPGLPATARLAAYPGKAWSGQIVDAPRQFDERLQTLKVKIQCPNDQADIWQGMFADIELECEMIRALAIPESAVIEDGEETFVFVAQPNNLFEPRKIETGLRAGSMVEVKHGLLTSDRVVESATFLLDSESRLRALAKAGAKH
jgi:membrane fusion protein, copper/silver efflux system